MTYTNVTALIHIFCGECDILLVQRIMVAQVGEPKGSPDSMVIGNAKPTWATTSEIGVS
ncbi:ash family protein [Buttiauxella selenatireducens]|uniref:Ash family protein n=1 Tax=Buttiauxella selenatireducens TaxID=3073902 RepID=A0ABY9SJV3_9ENTR|nr:ash family protein [Buttiauxella sp. R73]WMY76282.1 ash family protein [Buttiauxella sp. R73]